MTLKLIRLTSQLSIYNVTKFYTFSQDYLLGVFYSLSNVISMLVGLVFSFLVWQNCTRISFETCQL